MKNVATSLNKTFYCILFQLTFILFQVTFLWFMFNLNSNNPDLILRAGWASDTQIALELALGFT